MGFVFSKLFVLGISPKKVIFLMTFSGFLKELKELNNYKQGKIFPYKHL